LCEWPRWPDGRVGGGSNCKESGGSKGACMLLVFAPPELRMESEISAKTKHAEEFLDRITGGDEAMSEKCLDLMMRRFLQAAHISGGT
jgi:hypothetical protein